MNYRDYDYYDKEDISDLDLKEDYFVPKFIVDKMLHEIELKLENIQDNLKKIEGISEIDNVKSELKCLLSDLY